MPLVYEKLQRSATEVQNGFSFRNSWDMSFPTGKLQAQHCLGKLLYWSAPIISSVCVCMCMRVPLAQACLHKQNSSTQANLALQWQQLFL